ncbi:MAG: Spy/CpxP family protein refolding chaperone [Pseudomonadota bacterium]
MARRIAKILAAAITLGFGLETSFAPGVRTGAMSEAFAFGHGGGGHFGGGHFGSFGGGHFGGGHFGGFGGGHFGGGHFGGFGGGHFGGMHFGRHFGGGHFGGHFGRHFGGGHFGGGHFGRHFGGGHFGRHFGGGHFGRRLGGGHFGGGHFARGHFGGRGFGGAGGLGRQTAFAHNGFGGRGFGRFNGVHGFHPHGFNRNAFGSTAAWNAWGNNYWGAGWNDWGSGWGYWAGPVFWPFFFGDALTFALWPSAFYDPFFAYGPNLLLTSIFWPGPLFSPYYASNPYYYGENDLFKIYGDGPYANDIYGYGPYASGYGPYADGDVRYAYYGGRRHHRHHRRYARHHRRYAARSTAHAEIEAESNSALTCGGLAPGIMNLPIDQIERAIRPTDAQVAMLNDLKAASAKADNTLRSSCPTEVPLTPLGRLDAVARRIQTMIQAVQILRPPLATLYNSLDDEQKDRFAAVGAQAKYRRARIAREESPASDLGGLCKQQTMNLTQLPVQRIEELIKPTEQQNAAFDALKSASATAAADLDGSCPATMPESLTGRLDAVANRLDALAEAVNTVKPELTDFYDSLTDEQKARFNVIGSPTTTPQGETKTGG